MKTLTLPVHELQTPQELLALLTKESLRKGDRLDPKVVGFSVFTEDFSDKSFKTKRACSSWLFRNKKPGGL